jgi:hypothetical protein
MKYTGGGFVWRSCGYDTYFVEKGGKMVLLSKYPNFARCLGFC